MAQELCPSLQERMALFVNNEDMHDICFTFPAEAGDQGEAATPQVRRIPAHKMLLAIGSSVFKAMFYGPLAEQGKEVQVVDIDAGAFLEMLSYLYTDQAHLDEETALEVLYAAKKYDIPGLVKLCVDFVKSTTDWKKAITTYEKALLLDESVLTEHCLQTMDRNAHNIVNSNEQMVLIQRPLLALLLKRDTFCAREIDIFDAVCWWAKEQLPRERQTPADVRRALGDLLPLIRFPQMSLKEVVQIVIPASVLCPEEVVEVLSNYRLRKKQTTLEQLATTWTASPGRSERFPTRLRWRQEKVTVSTCDLPKNPDALSSSVPRFERCAEKGMRSIKLLVLRRLFLTRVRVQKVPFRFSLDKYLAVVRVLDLDINEVLFKQDFSLVREDESPVAARYDLRLDPVEFCPRVRYEIVLSFEPPSSASTSRTLKLSAPVGGSLTLDYYGQCFDEEARVDQLEFMA